MLNGLQNLFAITDATSARCSTWDRTGGNNDWVTIKPGETYTIAEIDGPGCIRHIYATTIHINRLEYRWAVLRMYWDGEKTPSVEVPFGDFFGVAHCSPHPLNSLAMTLNPTGEFGTDFGYNCYFPMPFAKGARITLENQGPQAIGGVFRAFWWHVDYEKWTQEPGPEVGRFHAQWRRENPTEVNPDIEPKNTPLFRGQNIGGKDNYVLLEAKGRGQLAGIHLQVDNLKGNWYGEGDDMIFIDGDTWPPSIHGTGTEEVFAGGACPNTAYNTPYAGFHMVDNKNFDRFSAMYRWYINDPVRFQKDIRVTIEHGHANNYENDYTSVAYWYQAEPHAKFPQLLPVDQRMPQFPEEFLKTMAEAGQIGNLVRANFQKLSADLFARLDGLRKEGIEAIKDNQFAKAPGIYKEIAKALREQGLFPEKKG